jgi:hypothetical protein
VKRRGLRVTNETQWGAVGTVAVGEFICYQTAAAAILFQLALQ